MNDCNHKTRLICALTGGDVGQMRQQMDAAAREGADAVECRLDLLNAPPDPAALHTLLDAPPLTVVVTNRPTRQGGRFAGDEQQRLAILRQAADLGATFVDVEDDVDTPPAPAQQTIRSHHDFARRPERLDEILTQLEASPAAVSKVAFAAGVCADAFVALDLLQRGRRPTIALAMGEAGLASRILARKFGAFGTFASLAAGAESAPGQPTLAELRHRFRWDALQADTSVYGVIGFPVSHSMSPDIHNAAFEATGHNGVYVPLLVRAGATCFSATLDAIRARPWLDWRGLSVTLPHKEHALAYVGPSRCDELTVQIGAVNTITFDDDGELHGTNTDYAAALDALCGAMAITRDDLAGRSVAVLGAGGVSRAIVAALAHYGATVTIYNRTVQRAHRLAAEFSLAHGALEDAATAHAEIVINCTPLGMHPEPDATPLPRLPTGAEVVFDTIYTPIETRLLREARAAGCRTVSGVEMFVNQAAAQFECWLPTPAPRDVMRQVVLDRLAAS
ncbi:MAG: shikimate dehydrogenase [Phycisphaerae bacterium]|nr:shikimate dehydrogenase [Phycisphaerae bacterium]